MSDEGWNIGDFSATVEQIISQFFVKLSASGDHVIQDDLLKSRLEEGVYSCICYYNGAWCNPNSPWRSNSDDGNITAVCMVE